MLASRADTIFCGRSDRVTQVHWYLHCRCELQQIADREKVVRARSHYGQRVKVKSDHVFENFLNEFRFSVAALMSVLIKPSLDTVDGYYEECPRAAGGVKDALLWVSLVPQFIEDVLREPVRGVVLP